MSLHNVLEDRPRLKQTTATNKIKKTQKTNLVLAQLLKHETLNLNPQLLPPPTHTTHTHKNRYSSSPVTLKLGSRQVEFLGALGHLSQKIKWRMIWENL